MSLAQNKVLPIYDPIQLIGVITQISGQTLSEYTVLCDGKPWRCTRAASCLLQPSLGDTVLISGPDPKRVYLLAVIEQANPAQAILPFTGQLTIESQQLHLQAQQGHWQINDLLYSGEKVKARVKISQLLGKAYELVVERLSVMSRNSTKLVSEVDKTRAGRVDIQAEKSARVHSAFTTVTAKELVKVDGKQIHMG